MLDLLVQSSLMRNFVFHFKTDKEKLEEMLALRGQGWSYTALAEKYECPKLTIRFLARKYGLNGETVAVVFTRQDYLNSVQTTPAQTTSTITTEERVSPGKTYAEYLRDSQSYIIRPR